MRYMSTIKQKANEGFTLIEVLIIAPVVILVISGFIALIIMMVGDVLAIRDRSNMSYEIRDTLDRIEQDSRLSTQFLTTSNTLLSPQGSDGNFTGTAAFSNSNSLIMGSLTTDKNPTDTTRQLIYYAKQPNDCGPQQSYNRPFISKIVYFVKDNSLWRRSYLLPYNTNGTPNDETVCAAPWQQNSCSPGYNPASRCQTNDVQIMQNVSSFSIKYFASPQSTVDIGAANALNATTIEVTINGQKTIAGRPITNSGSLRASKLNNIDADLPIPAVPSVTAQTTGPNTITFSWAAVPAATSYLISYNINGGAWIDATNNSTTLSYAVNAYRNDTITMRVTAKNSTGPSSTYGSAAASIPGWITQNLASSWVVFDSTPSSYSTPQFTKTSSETVILKGVIKNGNSTSGSLLFTLPDGYRPTHRLIFQTDTGGSPSRVDVTTAGEVILMTGNSNWVTLDGINFLSSNASYTWTQALPTFLAGWTNYGGIYSPLQSALDSTGRAHFQGLVSSGTNTNFTTIASLPVGQRAASYTHLPAASTGFNYTAFADVIHAKGVAGASTYYSLQAMYYPSTFNSWLDFVSPGLKNTWVNFDAGGHPLAKYAKSADGLVTVKGMVKNANAANAVDGKVIATLPVGSRPKERLCFATVSNAAHARLDVLPNGDIVTAGNVNMAWVSMDPITFLAEQ